MRIFTAAIVSILLSQQAIAAAYKCTQAGRTVYSGRPCPGGIEIQLAPAPPPSPVKLPGRLKIIYQDSNSGYRYNKRQRDRLCTSVRKLEQRNSQLLKQIRQVNRRRELELRNAVISDHNAMAAIDLYWQGKTDALQREYNHNQGQINRLRNMTSRRD